MRRGIPTIGVIAASLLAIVLMSQIAPAGYTRIDLTEDGKGRKLLSAVVPDGERVTLTWRHSQFALHVKEVFIAQNGILVQDQVTFSVPDGPPPPRVSPREVEDLYHTGGAFDARGLSRPFRRIVYRIGEIGDPTMTVQNRTVAFQQAAGFGGSLILTASRPALYEILLFRFVMPYLSNCYTSIPGSHRSTQARPEASVIKKMLSYLLGIVIIKPCISAKCEPFRKGIRKS